MGICACNSTVSLLYYSYNLDIEKEQLPARIGGSVCSPAHPTLLNPLSQFCVISLLGARENPAFYRPLQQRRQSMLMDKLD
jgi:hypothetical protein